jgi:glycosyltransferase involved in cell wall biosynthesis
MQPLRILIVAENASERMGGEAILPCHYFRLLRARGMDAHLIVHERTRAELKSLFPAERERIHFVKDLLLQNFFYRIGRVLPRRIDEATLGMVNQFFTQLRQRGIVRRLTTSPCVVHQPIPVSPRTPSLLYGLGLPVIIGPLNGGMEYPPAFRKSESPISRVIVRLARSSSNALNALFPGKRQASVVLVANQRTWAALPSDICGRVILLPENAVDTQRWSGGVAPSAGERGHFLFIGRLVDWKALDIAIEAVGKTPGATLDVIGDGPMLEEWRELVERLGIGGRIQFMGWRSQEQCVEHLRGCCALLLPSLYECGGAVVLEAMAMSRPVIATAWGGPLDYVDANCGILVEPTSRVALIDGFSAAMVRLQSCPNLAQQMGAAGRERLRNEFDWHKKIETMLAIYESTVPAMLRGHDP